MRNVLGLQVHEVIKAVIDPIHLSLGAANHEMPASDSPRKTGCNCRTCTSAAAFGQALSGVTCRVPLPEQAASPAGSSEYESLHEGLHSQVHSRKRSIDLSPVSCHHYLCCLLDCAAAFDGLRG